MRGVSGLALQGGHHNLLDLLVADRAWSARARFVGQSIEPTLHEPLPPLAHRLRPDPFLGSDFLVGFTCRTTQYDPRPLRQRLRRLRSPRPALQRVTFLFGQYHRRHRPGLRLTSPQRSG